VVKTDWPAPGAEITDAADALTLSTPALRVVVSKRPMRITVYDSAGTQLTQEHPQKGISWIARVLQSGGKSNAPREVRAWHVMPADARYYGFGEKAGPFERRNTAMTMWNSDIPAYSAATDPVPDHSILPLGPQWTRPHGLLRQYLLVIVRHGKGVA
jgi:alpha-glucosidase